MMAGLALGDLSDDNARESLRRVCTDTNEPTPVRGGAAIGWARLHDEEALEPLLEMLADPDHALRRFAATALGWLGDARAIGPLIEALQGDGQSEVRKQAVVALDKIGDPGAVEALLDAVYDDHPTVRWYAVRALPQFNDTRAIEPLIDALRQGNEDISAAAIAALAEVGDESAISTLEWAGENYVASYPEEYSFGEAAADAIARIRERLRAAERAQG
jgi:HEAT repeat protein